MSASEPTIVITGASGFVGRALTEDMTSRGFSVIPVSRRAVAGMHRVSDYRASPSADVLVHLAEEPVRGVVNEIGESYLAAAASVVRELCDGRYARVLYASSGSVYGDQNEGPYGIDRPLVGTDTYTQSKIINEDIVLGAGGVVVRLSNLVGIGMSSHNVVSDILSQLYSAGPVRVRDDKPVRDYLSVRDAAAAIRLLIGEAYRGAVNVGSGIGTSVRTLAEMMLQASGQELREIIATAPSAARSANVLDISRTRSLIPWTPTPLKTLLRSLVKPGTG